MPLFVIFTAIVCHLGSCYVSTLLRTIPGEKQLLVPTYVTVNTFPTFMILCNQKGIPVGNRNSQTQ